MEMIIKGSVEAVILRLQDTSTHEGVISVSELAVRLLSAVVTGFTIYLLVETGWKVSLRLAREKSEETLSKVRISGHTVNG